MKYILITLLFNLTIAYAIDDTAFEQFKVQDGNVKISKNIIIDTPYAKKFKKLYFKEFKKGPNFANSFRIVRLGCGTNCANIGVINMENGKIFETALFIDGSGDWVRNDIIHFKKDSRLMIMTGCLKEDKNQCGHFEYSWNGDSFKLEFTRLNSLNPAPTADSTSPPQPTMPPKKPEPLIKD